MGMQRRRARSLVAAVVMGVVGFAWLSSASAAPRQPVVYDALGDSYASGYGVPPYTACGQSAAAYARQLNGREKVALDNFVACAGATTATLVSGGQLNALDGNTDLVTLTIGGNDIGWGSVVGACLLGSDNQCTGAIAQARARITGTLPGSLDSVYAQVAARAPHARVLVTGYPHLFSPEYGSFLFASPAELQALNDGADLLDGVIADAAARHGFTFVDVTKRFADHGVNAPDPWLTGPFDPSALHPNVEGYQAYTAAVTAAVRPSQLK